MAESTKTVVFIDPNVTDWQNLVNGVEPGSLVFILDPRREGIRQITDKLAALTDIDSVQIISHGGDGSLQLGSTQLNSANLNSYSSQLQQWGKSLTATGDILLYGCDVAQGFVGKAFVQQISQLTGADVAASDDLTGSAALGGDWLLEYATGLIEAPLALQVQAMEAYTSVLPNYILGGYIGSWNLNSSTPTTTPFNKLTHLFYSFADVNTQGNVALPNDGDGYNDISKLQQIKAQNPNLKILISIGGANEFDFSAAAATVQSRANFTQSAIQLMKTNGFDGIDIDWEFPQANEDNNYIQLLAQLRQQINQASQNDGKQYLLTTAFSASPYHLSASDYGANPYDFSPQDLKATSDYVDFINVMSYDYHGPWDNPASTNHQSALYKSTNDNTYNSAKLNTDWAIQRYLSAGVPATDIVLGAPLYGHTWTGVNAGSNNGLFQPGTAGTDLTYQELYNRLGTNGYQSFWDNSAKVPYIYSSQTKVFSTYENNQSILGKTDYVKQQGLGGAFFWEITQDLSITSPDSLINVAATNLGINSNVSITLAVSPSSVTEDGTANLIYTFTRTGATTNALTVNYGITGTADSSDYTGATPGTGKTITFAAGASTATLTIDPTADTTVESNETVALTLASGTGYTVGTTTAVTGTITNDDSTNPIFNYNGSQYTLTSYGTWQEAQAEAQSLGGNLVTINNQAEQDWLISTFGVNQTLWIGLTDEVTEGTFKWVSGEISTYTNWLPGEPNNAWDAEDYVEMNFGSPGKWNDSSSNQRGIVEITNISPSITLAVSPSSVNEDGTTNLIYTFTRTGATTNALTVNYGIAGTADSSDYTGATPGTGKTITFAAGASTATLTIDPTADTTVESNETVALTLASGTGYTVGTTTAVTGTITNDDSTNPIFNYNGSQYTLTSYGTWQEAQAEAQSLGGNLVTINNQAEQDWLVSTFGVTENLWIGFTDEVTEGQFKWASGETSTYTNWSPGEPNNLGNEDYVEIIGNGKWNDLPSTLSRRGIIEIVLPTITLAVSPSSVTEDGTANLIYTFTRTGATTSALTVNYGITGTADGSDYTGATPGTGKTITFAAGASTATLTIDPTVDTIIESDETVALTLATGTGYTIGTTTAVTGTITNDDFPTITLAVSPSSVTEDGTTNLIYTFTRTGATTSALTVNYDITGTANSSDYTGATPGTGKTITFAVGSSTATLTIDPTADTTIESNETVVLTLTSGTGYTVGTTTAVTGTITNDDVALPGVTLAVSPSSVLENGVTNLIYTFTRTGATTNALTVNYGIAGTANSADYTGATPGTGKTITFAVGSSTATLTIDPTADTTVESDETVSLTLASGTGYTIGTTTAVTGTITNDDVFPTITLAVSPSSLLEDGTANLIYTFTRTGATANALTVNYGVAGTATFNNDYTQIGAASFTATTGTITFAAGSSTKTLTIDPTADTTVESNETVAVTLATGTGYTVGTTTAVTGTITNDDIASPSITLAVSPSSVTEDGTANLIYTFTRTGATTNALIVNYGVAGTATFNNDYTQIGAASFTATTGTITFGAGSSTKTLTIDPTADTTVESNETVALTLATGTGYTIGTTTAVTGTITNDDTAGPLTLTGDATNNNLVGGSGNDTFLGLGGQDTLTGGLGADRFRFNSPTEGMDTITDFSKTQGDKIELFGTGFNSLVWTDGVSNALAPSVFSMGTSANSWTNSIIYNNSNGIVYFDADALGSGSQVALAQLSPGLNLTNQDFIVSWV